MKELLNFLLGIVLLIIGVIMFLHNVSISSFTLFFRMNGMNVGAILIVLLVVSLIALLVWTNFLTGLVFVGLCITFFVCLILSVDVYIRHMTGLQMALILGTICVGVAFVLKGLLGISKADKEKKSDKHDIERW